jgi:outer membrane lipoprotein-sorting protein
MNRLCRIVLLGGLIAGLLLSGCTARATRAPDGDLQIETEITAEQLQSVLEEALADTKVQDVSVTLNDGYITVSGAKQRPNSDKTDTLSFRLDLNVSDGHITATISDVKLNQLTITASWLEPVNKIIAQNLENLGQQDSNYTLQSLTITSAKITMVWVVK